MQNIVQKVGVQLPTQMQLLEDIKYLLFPLKQQQPEDQPEMRPRQIQQSFSQLQQNQEGWSGGSDIKNSMPISQTNYQTPNTSNLNQHVPRLPDYRRGYRVVFKSIKSALKHLNQLHIQQLNGQIQKRMRKLNCQKKKGKKTKIQLIELLLFTLAIQQLRKKSAYFAKFMEFFWEYLQSEQVSLFFFLKFIEGQGGQFIWSKIGSDRCQRQRDSDELQKELCRYELENEYWIHEMKELIKKMSH